MFLVQILCLSQLLLARILLGGQPPDMRVRTLDHRIKRIRVLLTAIPSLQPRNQSLHCFRKRLVLLQLLTH